MGASICAHIEYKIDGTWTHYAAPHVLRDYDLFGLVAGVRSDKFKPVVAPKGLPRDVSPVTALAYRLSKSRVAVSGMTWLNGAEYRKLQDAYRAAKPGESYLETDLEETVLRTYAPNGSSLDAVEDVPEIEDFRAVFWFEN